MYTNKKIDSWQSEPTCKNDITYWTMYGENIMQKWGERLA